MKLVAVILSTFFCCLMLGCATVQYQKEAIYPKPREDKGLIYFYRPSSYFGAMLGFRIYDNGKRIGSLQSGSYFFYWAEPGEHLFSTETESRTTRLINVEGGKVYYVMCKVEMGIFVAAPSFTIVSAGEGESGVRQCRYGILPEKEENKSNK